MGAAEGHAENRWGVAGSSRARQAIRRTENSARSAEAFFFNQLLFELSALAIESLAPVIRSGRSSLASLARPAARKGPVVDCAAKTLGTALGAAIAVLGTAGAVLRVAGAVLRTAEACYELLGAWWEPL